MNSITYLLKIVQQIPSILLIDDDIATTAYNEVIIEDSGCVEKVISKNSAEEALVYLNTYQKTAADIPSLIFLDINMPTMNGWEFLDSYHQLEAGIRNNTKIFILSSSTDEQELEQVENHPLLLGIKYKPLSVEMLQEIAEVYF